MERKSYYNEFLAQDEKAGEFQQKVFDAIIPLVDEEFDKGYSPAEIQQIVTDIVSLHLSERKIRHAVAVMKENRKSRHIDKSYDHNEGPQ